MSLTNFIIAAIFSFCVLQFARLARHIVYRHRIRARMRDVLGD